MIGLIIHDLIQIDQIKLRLLPLSCRLRSSTLLHLLNLLQRDELVDLLLVLRVLQQVLLPLKECLHFLVVVLRRTFVVAQLRVGVIAHFIEI